MHSRKPDWLKVRHGGYGEYVKVVKALRDGRLHTVCEEAQCPNRGECWGCGTATFMILGATCTRNCGFCAVNSGAVGEPVDALEPERLAAAVKRLGLKYVVITSVDRDDLPDKGSGHYARCIRDLSDASVRVEVLIPDYSGLELESVVEVGPYVLAHNIEVVRRLQPIRDGRASYEKSLATLEAAKVMDSTLKTKSSIMLGLGETAEEVYEAMDDLLDARCDILVLGQYLQPTKAQIQVVEYVTPERFKEYGETARKKGFRHVVSEPLARTSYKAAEI